MLLQTIKHPFHVAALALMVGVGGLGAGHAIASPDASDRQQVQANAQIQIQTQTLARGAKIRSLSPDQLRSLVAFGLYGESAEKLIDDIAPGDIIVDDVVIASLAYTLIFVGADDVAGWDAYKEYLPKYVQEPARSGAVPTDEQVALHLRRLTILARENFNRLAAEELKVNRPAFNARFPSDWTDAQLRNAIGAAYEFDGNGDIAPVSQRAYNEYAALLRLSEAMALYNRIKPKL